MSEKIETYSPEVNKQVALGVEGAGEIEHTKLNEKVIIQRIAKYSGVPTFVVLEGFDIGSKITFHPLNSKYSGFCMNHQNTIVVSSIFLSNIHMNPKGWQLQ